MWVAAIQLTATENLEKNLAKAREFIKEAALHGATLVALPEHFAYLGPVDKSPPSAQPLDSPLVRDFGALARELGIFLLLGSFPELSGTGQLPYNTSALLAPDGRVLVSYRKIHLFDVDMPGGPKYQESRVVRPGADLVVAPLLRTPFVVGLSICYDLRFPELYRALVDLGANLLFIPAAFTLTTGRDHWEALVRARAIENQAYVIAPAQWGEHSKGRRSYGRSLIVDPWGTVLAQAPDREGIIYAELNHQRLAQIRQELPCLKHRRLG
jgi:predicted amidohydrolase